MKLFVDGGFVQDSPHRGRLMASLNAAGNGLPRRIFSERFLPGNLEQVYQNLANFPLEFRYICRVTRADRANREHLDFGLRPVNPIGTDPHGGRKSELFCLGRAIWRGATPS